MADSTKANQDETDKQEAEADELRTAVANAYAFSVGQEAAESFSAITFEELLQQQIDRIEGTTTNMRSNLLDRIEKVKTDVLTAVETIRSKPADYFKHDREGGPRIAYEEAPES
jgi:hypothetical protein